MAISTPNNIQKKYGELIRLLSLIGDITKVENKSYNCSIIHVFQDNKEFLSFSLEIISTNSSSLDVSWKILNSIGYISSRCFPGFMSQKNIFNTLMSCITDWYNQVVECNLTEQLFNAVHREKKIRKVFSQNWTLLNFLEEFGSRLSIAESTNKTTGKKFKSCVVTNDNGTSIYVGFYSKLGPLTKEEIIERKYELFVGLKENGKYYLHDNKVIEYEEVNLGL